MIRPSSSGRAICRLRSSGPRPILLSCQLRCDLPLQSNCSTGSCRRSQSGAPRPASSNWTEAKPVLQSTASAASRSSRSPTPRCTAASRKLLTHNARGARPWALSSCRQASTSARSPACNRARYKISPTRGPGSGRQSWGSGSGPGCSCGGSGMTPFNRLAIQASRASRLAAPPSRRAAARAWARGAGTVPSAPRLASSSAVPASTSSWRRWPPGPAAFAAQSRSCSRP